MTKRQIEIRNLAHQVLERANITSPPVDVNSIAKLENVDVFRKEIDADISGVLKIDENARASILVNQDHHMNRQRFTIAHELGHYFLHNQPGIHVDKVFLRDPAASEGLHLREIEANRFAAELLMPEFLLVKSLEKQLSISRDNPLIDPSDEILQEMAQEFQVSKHAMSIKLQELGYSFQPY
jgi:Zn-dependent peptidase ImmA (M78 family)